MTNVASGAAALTLASDADSTATDGVAAPTSGLSGLHPRRDGNAPERAPEMNRQVLPLGEPTTTEIAVAGAKAAGLSRARRAGLPVLDGFVLTVNTSAETLQSAAETLAERGSGAARLAIMRTELDAELLSKLRESAKRLPEPLIVRSSSVLEGGGEWAGAFSSLGELRRDEVAKAILSMWAGVFALESLDRFETAGIRPENAHLGALIQPEIAPDFGGSARVDERGIVNVSAVAGSPRDLLAGWVSGAHALVAGNGEISGQEAEALLGNELLRGVARLARRVEADLGYNLIEWAVCRGDVILLQVQKTPSNKGNGIGAAVLGEAGGAGDAKVLPAALGLPGAQRLARLAVRYRGALGEELVLGWRSACDITETVGSVDGGMRNAKRGKNKDIESTLSGQRIHNPATTDDRLDLLAEARSLAADLTAAAWGRPAPEAVATAALALRRLRGDRPNESIEALNNLEAVDTAAAGRLLNILEHLAASLPQPDRIWYYTPEELAQVLSGAALPRSGRVGRDRWEPFLAGVAALCGVGRSGLPASGGVGAGRLRWVSSPTSTRHVRPRDVIVVQYPLPNFAPLLWDAAGLITLGGAPSAHLIEVARSLAVPTVTGCPVGDLLGADGGRLRPTKTDASDELRIAVVDGDEGRAAVLRL